MNSDNKVVQLRANEDVSRYDGHPQSQESYYRNGGDGGGGGDMQARVAKLESDVSYIRRDVNELKTDVKAISQNMVIAIERLESIKDSLSKKPSSDAVDKKIADARLAILLGVPAIIAIGTGIYKLIQPYL